MSIPETLPQVLIFVALLVPGFSYVTVRTWYVGLRSPDNGAGARILEALYVSAIFVVIYAGLFLATFVVVSWFHGVNPSVGGLESWLNVGARTLHAWLVPVGAVTLLVGIPGLVAWWRYSKNWTTVVKPDGSVEYIKTKASRNLPTPRAWDHAAFGATSPRFVRILTDSGVYVGGWYGEDSYTSTFPFDRDLYISRQWRMSRDGEFLEPLENSLGVWVPITDTCVVEWIAADSEGA